MRYVYYRGFLSGKKIGGVFFLFLIILLKKMKCYGTIFVNNIR